MNFDVDIYKALSYYLKGIVVFIFVILTQTLPALGNGGLELGNSDVNRTDDVVEYLYSETENNSSIYNESTTIGTKEFSYRKCYCDLQEVKNDGVCEFVETNVIVPHIHNLLPESDILTSFVLSPVIIKDVKCSSESHLTILSQENFFILKDGDLYSEELGIIISNNDYCFELLRDKNEGENTIHIISRTCIPKPEIPFCPSNNIVPNSMLGPFNVSLINNVDTIDKLRYKQVTEPICEEQFHQTILPLNKKSEAFSFHYVSGTLELLWRPLFPSRVPQVYSSDKYCLTNSNSNQEYEVKLCYDNPVIKHEKLCEKSICVRKCCPDQHIYDLNFRKCSLYEGTKNISFAKFYSTDTRSVVAAPNNVLFEYSFPWCEPQKLYMVDPATNPADEFLLLNNGSLFISLSQLAMPPSLYCIDSFLQQDEVITVKAISCFLDPVKQESKCLQVHKILYPILIVISCAFLTITLIVYAVITELRTKLHGKSLLSHVSSLLIAFLCQLIVSWNSSSLSMTGCKIIALGNQVSFLWAFFWLNVMCFDIWWTLKSMRIVPETGESSRKRFVLYSLYAWGCPIIICFFTAIMEFLPNSVDKTGLILPGFGLRGCWFQDVKSTWIYFHGFTLFLYVLNIFFFFHVAAILINGQRSTEGILRTTKKQHRERVFLYLKLFVVMGITWICEVASWQEGTCEYWIFTDIINSLQGVMIFFIFMCNKKVFQKIQAKGVPIFRRMKALVRSPSSTESAGNTITPRTSQTSDESSTRRLSSSVPPQENQLIRKF